VSEPYIGYGLAYKGIKPLKGDVVLKIVYFNNLFKALSDLLKLIPLIMRQ
jgi:hypothetical protein